MVPPQLQTYTHLHFCTPETASGDSILFVKFFRAVAQNSLSFLKVFQVQRIPWKIF